MLSFLSITTTFKIYLFPPTETNIGKRRTVIKIQTYERFFAHSVNLSLQVSLVPVIKMYYCLTRGRIQFNNH